MHLMLPHSPWRLDATGASYGTGFGLPDTYPFTGKNDDGPWISAVTEQRHLLQAQYTDALVGDVIDELRARDLYEDSLIVVVADHGASFETDTPMRSLADDRDDGLDALAYTPLLIKAPGQTKGAVDDSNLMAIDVLPTVANLLGMEIDFDVEGLPAGDPAIAERGSEKVFYDSEGGGGGISELQGVRTFDGDQHRPSADDRWIPPLDAGAPLYAGLYERFDLTDEAALIGTPLDDVVTDSSGDGHLPLLSHLQSPPADAAHLGMAGGYLEGAPAGDGVVLAINGEIVAVSPVYAADGHERSFAFLFSNRAVGDGQNDIRLAVLDGDAATEVAITG
jgi:hypothetical protein